MHNDTMAPITEPELRNGLKAWLFARSGSRGVRMLEEFGIERGAARIDLAVVSSGLEAYELKSDLDTFSRLHNQIHAYNRVFDRLWIVIGSTHVLGALAVVPRWWGILAAYRIAPISLEFRELRAAESNPIQDATSLAQLLWRDEALQLMRLHGLKTGQRATRAQLSQRLAEMLDVGTLRESVAQFLTLRSMATAVRL